MKNKKGLLLIFMGLLLVAAALFLTAYNLYDEQRAAVSAERVLRQLSPQIPHTLPAEEEPEETGEAEPEQVFPDYVLNPYMELPTIEVDGRDYIGVLEIPALELELPVMSSWSYPNLKVSPCRYAGSAYLNDMVLASHSYTRHFGRLKTLSEGDAVIFTDADGNVFTYEVALLEILMPADVEEMKSGDWDLTLFTCTAGSVSRMTVRCELVTEN